ncbi:MAG: 4-hydroxy-tetrahydrodipicolinate synthase [Ruminococcaceae bacterium]|nr:4-hydroxy-tetrahydrodipicolinate synthase [Oscillospiraceae bacterium]
MKKPLFTGSAVALITPFKENGVDYDKFAQLIEYHIENGTDALVVCATTGESSTMPDPEHMAALKFASEKAKGRITLIAGTGSNDTIHAIALSTYAESVGYDGLLIVTPYYNKATQKGLYLHFKAIAESVKLPIILYNIPGRTGCSISIDTFKKLAEIPNIIGVKEATGDLALAGQIAAFTDLVLYSGNDDVILPMMAIGGKGVISVVANILPKETHEVCQKFLDGDIEGSRKQYLKMIELINALFIEVNPIPVKAAMNVLGFNVGKCRMPLCDMEDKNLATLKQVMKNYGFKF